MFSGGSKENIGKKWVKSAALYNVMDLEDCVRILVHKSFIL